MFLGKFVEQFIRYVVGVFISTLVHYILYKYIWSMTSFENVITMAFMSLFCAVIYKLFFTWNAVFVLSLPVGVFIAGGFILGFSSLYFWLIPAALLSIYASTIEVLREARRN